MDRFAPFRACRVLFGLFAALLLAPAAFAGFEGTEQFIAATGNPVGGTARFDSTFWASNLGSSPISFTFQFLRSGQANPSPPSFSDSLAAGETKMYPSVIGTKFSLTNVNGGARITSSGPLLAGMRLFNQPTGTPLASTAGQFFPGVPKSFSIGPGQTTSLQAVYTGTGQDFRYNFVLLETSGANCGVHVRVLDANGTELGAKDYSLLAYEQLIDSSVSVAPAANTNNARIVATVTSGPGHVLLAGSQVGNSGPQDQSAIEMSYAGALLGSGGGVTSLNGFTGDVTLSAGTGISLSTLGGNNITINATGGGGGLAAVAHDITLTGNGTIGSPLGIAFPLTLSGSSSSPLLTLLNGSTGIGVEAFEADMTSTSPGPTSAAVVGHNHGTGASGIGVVGFQDGHGWGVYGSVTGAGIGLLGTAGAGGIAMLSQEGGGSGTSQPLPVGAWGDSANGTGVLGTSSSTGSFQWYGVQGYGGLGVEGIGSVAPLNSNTGRTFSYGVEGDAFLVGQDRIGIFGYASGGTTSNYAGYFVGNININGTTHTSGAATVLDDPADPENKLIYHSSVESADMKNLYDGVVTLDARGEAVVELPAWLEALNRDFRYQLTCIGGFSAVWIEREVAGGQFTIKGEKPGQRVSWQLTGIRQDAWANAHRIPVEVNKSETERGYLLHPVEYGRAIEQGVDWLNNPQFRRAVERQRAVEAAATGSEAKQ